MLYSSYFTLLACTVLCVSASASLQAGHVKFDLKMKQPGQALNKRETDSDEKGYVNTLFLGESTLYSIELSVGREQQVCDVQIDTTISDLWVVSKNASCDADSEYYSSNDDYCLDGGTFDPEYSSSFQSNTSNPDFFYNASEFFAKGTWGTDTISWSSYNLSDYTFAVVNDTSYSRGVMGIGFPQMETTYAGECPQCPDQPPNRYEYENLPFHMKTIGAINKVVYSLYLSLSGRGQLLFGAVNHQLYNDKLQTVPIVNVFPDRFKKPARFDIMLDTISLNDRNVPAVVHNVSVPVLLNSRFPLTILFSLTVKKIASELDAWYEPVNEFYSYRVLCPSNESSSLTFSFSGVEIEVPLHEFVTPIDALDESNNTCYLAFPKLKAEFLGSSGVLGQNFLRHAYTVYDMEDYEVSLAQVTYTGDNTDGEGDDNGNPHDLVFSTVPGAVKAPGYYTSSGSSLRSSQTSSLELTLGSLTRGSLTRGSLTLGSPSLKVLGPAASLGSLGSSLSSASTATHFAWSLVFSMIGFGAIIMF